MVIFLHTRDTACRQDDIGFLKDEILKDVIPALTSKGFVRKLETFSELYIYKSIAWYIRDNNTT